MNKTLKPISVKKTADTIRSRKIPYLAHFGDTLNRYIDIMLRKDNDSRVEWAILSLLIVRGGSSTPTRLAKELFRSKHSITRFIDSLFQKGFVVRIHEEKDRRSIKVEITDKGLQRMAHSFILFDQNWENILKQLTPDEWSVYLNITSKLQKSLLQEIGRSNKSFL